MYDLVREVDLHEMLRWLALTIVMHAACMIIILASLDLNQYRSTFIYLLLIHSNEGFLDRSFLE